MFVEGQETESPNVIEEAIIKSLKTPDGLGWKSMYVEARDLRNRAIKKEGIGEGTLDIDIIRESKSVEVRKRIGESEMSEAELEQVEQFNDWLLEDPKRERENLLCEALIKAQETRLKGMGVGINEIKIATEHLKEIIRWAGKAGVVDGKTRVPILKILAAVHDIDKMVPGGKSGYGEFLIAEHEIMSANLAGDAVRAAMEAVGCGYLADGVVKLTEKAVICHGEGEYPQLNAKNNQMFGEDLDAWCAVLFGGVYVNGFKSGEIHISNLSDENPRVKFARNLIKGLSTVDKLVGITNKSLLKYDATAHLDEMVKHENLSEYFSQYMTNSFRTNIENATDVFGLKSLPEVKEQVSRITTLRQMMESFSSISASIGNYYEKFKYSTEADAIWTEISALNVKYNSLRKELIANPMSIRSEAIERALQVKKSQFSVVLTGLLEMVSDAKLKEDE